MASTGMYMGVLAQQFQWNIVWQFLFKPAIVQGVIITVVLAVLAQITGTVIGLLIYLLRRTILRPVADFYIWIFRGTPLLVQLLFLTNIFPYLGLTRALNSSTIFNDLGFQYIPLSAFLGAFLAFSFNEGAYMAEIMRAGIDAIDPGQMEAAKSLGMSYGLSMRRVILPQAARVIIPPLGNEFNSMLKTTSLASAFGVLELYNAGAGIGQSLFQPLELAVDLSIWYLLMTTLWGFVQSYLERRFNASTTDGMTNTTFLDRILGRGNKSPSPTKETTAEAAISGGRR
ncbi:MAG: amino acid ABC transporter permease [Ktedonobacterales bacterium]|nr:amino acid ABC transporter permease [Ktedonobacterales bacterium]